jgi:hypothetical protein
VSSGVSCEASLRPRHERDIVGRSGRVRIVISKWRKRGYVMLRHVMLCYVMLCYVM